jgi:kynurenine formamidase
VYGPEPVAACIFAEYFIWGILAVGIVREAATGLEYCELSQPFGFGVPVWPGDDDVRIWKSVYHSRDGVLSQKLSMNMHCSTHMTAPIHLVQGGAFVAQLPIDLFFGAGVVLKIPKSKWEYVTAADLDVRSDLVNEADIVLINTGWHHKYSDSREYFGEAPGLSEDAADWLVAKGVKLVGTDTAAIDHPLATNLGIHRGGPKMRYLPGEYREETGRDPKEDFKKLNPAQKRLLESGIPTISNIGGDIDLVSDRRGTYHAMPWKWIEGDACVIHLLAISDPSGTYRIEKGDAA